MLHALFAGIALALLLCTLPLLLEVLLLSVAALLPPRRQATPAAGEPCRLAVVVPAHNEAAGIQTCVRSLCASKHSPDAIYVVAHNCTDDTAEQAEAAGADALTLQDDGAHGKGAALLFGMDHALRHGHTAVLVIDADSTVCLKRWSGAPMPCRHATSRAIPAPRERR